MEKEKQAAAGQRNALKGDYAAGRQARAEDRKRVKAVTDAETRVHELEALLSRLEEDLHAAGARQDIAAIERIGIAYTDTQAALHDAMEQWMELAEQVG